MKLLEGKVALVVGIANNYSLAYGIAKKLHEAGAQLILTYPNEQIKTRVEPIGQEFSALGVYQLDVSEDSHFASLSSLLANENIKIDIMIHSVAFAAKEDLKEEFTQTSRAGFKMAMDISCYSLIAMCNHFLPLLNKEASIMTLSYYGSQKVVQNYNVMGVAKAALEASVRYLAQDLGKRAIRINAISAGPVKTLAASGISGFRSLLSQVEEKAPLKQNISSDDVGGMALFLSSSLSQKVTGQVLYVDSGLSILGGF